MTLVLLAPIIKSSSILSFNFIKKVTVNVNDESQGLSNTCNTNKLTNAPYENPNMSEKKKLEFEILTN